MTSGDLTTEQASRLYEALFPHVNYLLRLKKRMEELRFAEDDPLVIAATKANQAAWELRQEAHWQSVKWGVQERRSCSLAGAVHGVSAAGAANDFLSRAKRNPRQE